MVLSHNLGFPRIGKQRELKFALEAYWGGKLTQTELLTKAEEVQQQNYTYQKDLDLIQVGDFSLYDQVLDTSALLGVIPERYEHKLGQPVDLDTLFRVARGKAPVGATTFASEMTKWFNTNYHYIVPEVVIGQEFQISTDKIFNEIIKAKKIKEFVKPVILGPITWLYLAKTKGSQFDKLTLLPKLVEIYQQILTKIDKLNVEWVQIDEPILGLDLTPSWLAAYEFTYPKLADVNKIKLLLTTYFGSIEHNFATVNKLPIAGLHIDAVTSNQLESIAAAWSENKVLSVGIINGHNVWANDLRTSLAKLMPLAKKFVDNLWIGPSCSLLHTPVDLTSEDELPTGTKNWFAFAAQKITEITTLTKGLNLGITAIEAELDRSDKVVASREQSKTIHNIAVQNRVAELTPASAQRNSEYKHRAKQQQQYINLPLFPTTTIGSFPQTSEIRTLRKAFRQGDISESDYVNQIKTEIAQVIKIQEDLGLDVLVHGEPERTDMVEYFGQFLQNFIVTKYGWVQSYGSRCVKPPIIVGDVWLEKPITVEWIKYAKSLTNKQVKGMLTGPVTILAWSFKREDIADKISAYQIALALRDEVKALEAAGIAIIQVDEPAFRELLPLRKIDQAEYFEWAETAFRIATSVAADSTQIHTHMCYSEFNEIMDQIANLDSDVITIETSRSDMELLQVFEQFEYPNEIGPGVYDIHSPRVPNISEIERLLVLAAKHIPIERLWVNPDCGLKTRNWEETKAALTAMVQAAQKLRETHKLES